MTDDEIDADLRPVMAKVWDCRAESVIIYGGYRLAYRAGMLRAAQIALKQEYALWGARAGGIADAIDRAASEPPAA